MGDNKIKFIKKDGRIIPILERPANSLVRTASGLKLPSSSVTPIEGVSGHNLSRAYKTIRESRKLVARGPKQNPAGIGFAFRQERSKRVVATSYLTARASGKKWGALIAKSLAKLRR